MVCGKWTAFIQKPLKITLQYCLTITHQCTHSHTDGGVNQGDSERGNIAGNIATMQCCLSQRHLDTQQGGAGVRTSNLPVSSQPTLPPEPHATYTYVFWGSYGSATYLDFGQKAVEDTHAQGEGLWEKVEQATHLSQPQHQVTVLRQADVCTLQGVVRRRGRTTSQHMHLSAGAGDHGITMMSWPKPPGVFGRLTDGA